MQITINAPVRENYITVGQIADHYLDAEYKKDAVIYIGRSESTMIAVPAHILNVAYKNWVVNYLTVHNGKLGIVYTTVPIVLDCKNGAEQGNVA